MLQALGSGVVRRLSGLEVPDAVSGFRAISREAALRLNIVSSFSYTIEMLIQAGRKRMAVAVGADRHQQGHAQVAPVQVDPEFIKRSVATMLRIYAMYQPLKVFAIVGGVLAVIGVLPIFRFLYFYAIGDGEGHVQSLILGGALVIIAVVSFLIGLVADLIGFNRQLLEMTLEKVREMELKLTRMEEDRRAGARPAGRPGDRHRRLAGRGAAAGAQHRGAQSQRNWALLTAMASATTTSPRPSLRPGGTGMRIARVIGFVLLAVSAVYFVVAAWKYAGELPPIAWNAGTAAVLGWVTLAYLVQFLTAGMGWHLWLSAVGEPSRPTVAITLFTLSQFASMCPAASRSTLRASPSASATASACRA